ncbi:MAG: hypothetical protein LBL39_05980, partial [Planctomycetaceae bacterium]|nr:hypothetical protein [Planctomycetaceae bacterium]
MLRYSLIDLSFQVIFSAVSADVLFAQPSQQNVAESQPQTQANNRRRLPNVQIQPKMFTVLGRSLGNFIDKGLP